MEECEREVCRGAWRWERWRRWSRSARAEAGGEVREVRWLRGERRGEGKGWGMRWRLGKGEEREPRGEGVQEGVRAKVPACDAV